MSDNLDAAELEALALDPQTDWDVLHWIAENYPQLRPAVASNPGTYQELIDALAHLGDPAIDEAIALRPLGKDVSSAQAATSPMAGMWDTMTHRIPAYRDETPDYSESYEQYDDDALAAGFTEERQPATADEFEPVEELEPEEGRELDSDSGPQPAAASQTAREPEPDSELEHEAASEPEAEAEAEPAPVSRDASDTHASAVPVAATHGPATSGSPAEPQPAEPQPAEPQPAEPQPAAPEPAPRPSIQWPASTAVPTPAAYSSANLGAETDAETDADSRRRSPLVLVAAVLVGVVAVGAVIALIANLLGGGEDAPVAEPAPSPTQEQPAPAEDEDPEGEDPADEGAAEETTEPVDEQALAETRTAVASLPEATNCQVGDDAGVVAAFLETAGAAEGAPTAEDTAALEDGFGGLQSECSATHAAGVFEAARSGSQAAANEAGEMLTDMGTDWVSRSIGLGGAQEMDGFVTPDGNIQCEFGDGVRCTAYEHSYSAPAGCTDGTTYRMQVDGGSAAPFCDEPVERTDRDTLAVDSSATDGFLVCLSLSDRVSCYNSVAGGGFEISERGHYPY